MSTRCWLILANHGGVCSPRAAPSLSGGRHHISGATAYMAMTITRDHGNGSLGATMVKASKAQNHRCAGGSPYYMLHGSIHIAVSSGYVMKSRAWQVRVRVLTRRQKHNSRKTNIGKTRMLAAVGPNVQVSCSASHAKHYADGMSNHI